MHFSSLSGPVLFLLVALSASPSLFVNGWLKEYQRSLPSIYATQFQRLRGVNFNNVRRHTLPNPAAHPEAVNKDTSSSNSSSGLVLTLNLTDYQQTFWTTNISVGTPTSAYRVVVAPFASDLILASAGAVYNGSDASFLPLYYFLSKGGGGGSSAETLAGRQEYNASASNTSSSVAGSNGYQNFMNDSGSSVTDTVGLGGVSGGWNLTFAAADTVDFLIDQLPVDGLLGLDGSGTDGPSSTLPNVPFIQQLVAAGAIAEPTVQWALSRGQDTAGGNGTLTLGGTDPVHCSQADTVYPANASCYGYPVFNISAVGDHVASYGVIIMDVWWPIYVDTDTLSVFVSATNATTKYATSGYCSSDSSEMYPVWTVACDLLSSGADIPLVGVNGVNTTLHPADYITRTRGSKCELSVKDNGLLKGCAPGLQFDTWFALGQQFLNSRCLQVDLSTGVWGVSSRVDLLV